MWPFQTIFHSYITVSHKDEPILIYMPIKPQNLPLTAREKKMIIIGLFSKGGEAVHFSSQGMTNIYMQAKRGSCDSSSIIPDRDPVEMKHHSLNHWWLLSNSGNSRGRSWLKRRYPCFCFETAPARFKRVFCTIFRSLLISLSVFDIYVLCVL